MVSVGLLNRKDVTLPTGSPAPFDQINLPQYTPVYTFTVSPTYDATQHSCSYVSGEVPAGTYVLSAGYAIKDPATGALTWKGVGGLVGIHSRMEEITIVSDQTIAKDVSLEVSYVR